MAKFEPIELGDRVKDPVSGLTGIVTAVTTWLHGCIRIAIQPETVKDGKPAEAQAFDQSQLVLIKKHVHTPMVLAVVPAPAAETRRSNGGPAIEPRNFARR